MWLTDYIKKYREKYDCPDGAETYRRLGFLEEYGFKGEPFYDGRMCNIKYSKPGLLIEYYEFYQFREFCVTVYKSSDKSDQFDFVKKYEYGFFYRNVLPLMKTRFNKKRFSNLEMVEFYIHNQIENGDSVFGINKDNFINQ